MHTYNTYTSKLLFKFNEVIIQIIVTAINHYIKLLSALKKRSPVGVCVRIVLSYCTEEINVHSKTNTKIMIKITRNVKFSYIVFI